VTRVLNSVSRTLDGYAGRGVFRGYTAEPGPRGTRRFRFLWLTRRPMTIQLDPARGRLVFQDLFPAAARQYGVVEAVRAVVASASSAERPAHRRLHPRRAKMTCRFVRGHGSLELALAGSNAEPAVRAALGLVNELFLVLHECFPDYLIAEFGASPE